MDPGNFPRLHGMKRNHPTVVHVAEKIADADRTNSTRPTVRRDNAAHRYRNVLLIVHPRERHPHRRAGHTYPLRGPMEAIPGEQLAQSIDAVDVLAAQFRNDNVGIAALSDPVGVILRVEAERPGSLQ